MTGSAAPSGRWAWAEIDLDAFAHNVRRLAEIASPASLWAVVKADGYGHGAVAMARTALTAGASGLCVALVTEGTALRAAGIVAPVLVLSEQPPDQAADAVGAQLVSTVSSRAAIGALAAAASAAGVVHRVHLKVDTGMHRVGCAPSDAVELAREVVSTPSLHLDGVFTHLACADDPAHPSNASQLAVFSTVLDELIAAGLRPELVHAANSAGALAHPSARFDAVRTGIAMYGIAPGPAVAHLTDDLRPVMSLHARVSFVKRLPAGAGVSYGLRHRLERDATIATVPIGYADGVPRRLWSTGGEVLIGGRRCRIVGVVTMDQLLVDAGDDPVAVGDPVVLIGAQGDERITADDWAQRLDTIGYEIVCGVSSRIERVLVGDR